MHRHLLVSLSLSFRTCADCGCQTRQPKKKQVSQTSYVSAHSLHPYSFTLLFALYISSRFSVVQLYGDLNVVQISVCTSQINATQIQHVLSSRTPSRPNKYKFKPNDWLFVFSWVSISFSFYPSMMLSTHMWCGLWLRCGCGFESIWFFKKTYFLMFSFQPANI